MRLIRWAFVKLPFFCLLLGCAAASAQAAPTKILVFGDSLVSGYGLKPDEAFPPMLGMRLHADGYDVLIANGGVPGETTTLAFARLEAALESRPDLVILELGAYRRRFDALYPELARSYATALYPYFLEGVGGNPALTQEGGLHPNAKGVQAIVGQITPLVERTLAQMGVKPRRSSLISE